MTTAPFSLQNAVLRPSEISERLGVERSTVYRWIRSGELPSVELGGTKYVLITAYERFAERRKKGVTLEEQAAREIGLGEEIAGEAEPFAGLSLPTVPRPQASAPTPDVPALDDVRQQLRGQLDDFEARFHITSERVHRLYLVERVPHVSGVPDDTLSQWANCYAAYASLSLVSAH